MRRWIALATYLGLATSAAAVALAGVGDGPRAAPAAAAISSSGALETSNSHEGQPIFVAHGIAPGGSTSGTVAIEDRGPEAVELVLRRGELSDSPGLGGGVLSSRLELTVVDVTEPTSPRSVYSGPLDSMPDQAAGVVEPGRARSYEFTASLPETGGSGLQNEVQGAATEVAYSWIAGAPSGGGEGPGGGGGESPGGGGTPPGNSGVGSASAGTSGAAPTLPIPPGPAGRPGLNLALTRVRSAVRAGRLLVWVGCEESCRIEVEGRLRISAGGRHRVGRAHLVGRRHYLAGPQRLRILVPGRLRRWARTTTGPLRLRAELTFHARDRHGERDALHRTLRLRLKR